jgi:hypothetical protein
MKNAGRMPALPDASLYERHITTVLRFVKSNLLDDGSAAHFCSR